MEQEPAVQAMDVRVQHLPGYTRLSISGSPSLGEMLGLIDMISFESTEWPSRRVLVDLLQVQSLTAFTEQFTIGEAAGRKLGHLERMASLVPPERITRTSEKAARRTGLALQVFDSEAKALAWLLEGTQPEPG